MASTVATVLRVAVRAGRLFPSCLLFLLLASAGAVRPAAADPPLFTFAQISDSQPNSEAAWSRFAQVLDTLVAAGTPGALLPQAIDFVVFPGDLISHATSLGEWQRFVALVDTKLTAAGIPYRAAPGNHDQDGFGVGNYELHIGHSGVWDTDTASVEGHNGPSVFTGWSGLRIIGFNNSNGAWNRISSQDRAEIESRVLAAQAAGENVYLLGHHPHDGEGLMPLASVLTNPAICCYGRGHSGSVGARRGLASSRPDVWDLNSNSIIDHAAVLYVEAHPGELHVYPISLLTSSTALPAAKVVPLLFPLRPASLSAPTADFAADPSSGAAPLAVRFTDLSTGPPTAWSWSFGDGASSSLRSPTHGYAAPGVYEVSLTASNSLGSSTVTRAGAVIVEPPPPSQTFVPVADAQVRSSSPTKNYGSDPSLRVRAGDPTYRSYLRFDLSGISGAVLSAKLRLYTTDGSVDGGTVYAVDPGWSESGITYATAPPIGGPPLASAGPVNASVWVDYDVGAVVTGDGSYAFALTSASSDSIYFSSREGANPPQLVVQLDLSGPPSADFTGSPTAGPAPLAVGFTDRSTGGATSWLWDFGDGATSTEPSPTHTYATPGSYDVGLVAGNAAGWDTRIRPGYVQVSTAAPAQVLRPVADARVSASSPTSNYGSDGTLRVRGGSSPHQSFLRFDLAQLGGRSVLDAKLRLYCTDPSSSGGSVHTAAGDWTESGITYASAPPIEGAALATAGAVAVGEWVELDVTSASRGSGSVSFALASAVTNSAYYSSREGASPPELVVRTSEGTAPQADFDAAPLAGPVPLAVAFRDLSQGGAVSWLWSFGDGATSTEQNPVHVYGQAGLYDVTLVVANARGSDSAIRPGLVEVDPPLPTASFAPVADAKVSSAKPDVNYGSTSDLRLRSSNAGSFRSFLRFEVTGVGTPIARATLRLHVDDGSQDGGALHVVSGGFSESLLTWNNAPPLGPAPIASLGPVAAGTWVEVDLTALVRGDGAYAFGLANASSDSVRYGSRESPSPPELRLELAAP